MANKPENGGGVAATETAVAETGESMAALLGAEGVFPQEEVETQESEEAGAEVAEAEESEEGESEAGEAEGAESEEAEEAEAENGDAEDQPPAVRKLLKRVNKLTAREKAAQEAKAAMEAELAQVKAEVELLKQGGEKGKPAAGRVDPQDPLADVVTLEELTERRNHALEIQKWALAHWDGGTVKGKDGEDVEVPAEKVREYFAESQELLNRAIPQRAQYLAQLQQYEAEAAEAYPELSKDGTEEAKAAEAVLTQLPEMRRFPNHKLFIGDWLRGRKARMEAAAAAAGKAKAEKGAAGAAEGAKPKLKLAPVAGGTVVPAALAADKAKAKRLEAALASGGSVDAIAAAL